MKKNKKMLLTIGLWTAPVILLGGVATPVVLHELQINGSRTVTNGTIDIAEVIPSGSPIGNINITVGDKPNNQQILSAINIWIQGQTQYQKDNWHINQVSADNISTTSCTIKVFSWAPDYDSSTTTTVVFTTTPFVAQQTLKQALTGDPASPNTIKLNSLTAHPAFATYLNGLSASNINPYKADNTKALLKWLDGENLYNGSLNINQIEVKDELEWVSGLNLYQFTITPVDESNVYMPGDLTVTFEVSRTLINTIQGLDTTLDFIVTPSQQEIYNQFTALNTTINTTNLPISSLTFGSVTASGTNFTVTGNEYYYTNANVVLTWLATAQELLTDAIKFRNLGQLIEVPDQADVIYLVNKANPNSTIQWNEITFGTISNTGVTLTARAGSIYYTGSASIGWTI